MNYELLKPAIDLAVKCYWLGVSIIVILIILALLELTLELSKYEP